MQDLENLKQMMGNSCDFNKALFNSAMKKVFE